MRWKKKQAKLSILTQIGSVSNKTPGGSWSSEPDIKCSTHRISGLMRVFAYLSPIKNYDGFLHAASLTEVSVWTKIFVDLTAQMTPSRGILNCVLRASLRRAFAAINHYVIPVSRYSKQRLARRPYSRWKFLAFSGGWLLQGWAMSTRPCQQGS